MKLRFSGELFYWRGPAPFHFIAVPAGQCRKLKEVAPVVSYGWGVIPVIARIGSTEFTTSLFPKQGGYLLPVKDAVRQPEQLELGDDVSVLLIIDV